MAKNMFTKAVDRLVGTVPSYPSPQELQGRIAEQERLIKQLESDTAAASLSWASGNLDADKRDEYEKSLKRAEGDLRSLRLALMLSEEAQAREASEAKARE